MSRPEALVEFVRALRAEGIGVGSVGALDLLRGLELVGASPAEDVYWAFRSLAIYHYHQVPAFDRVFTRFFGPIPEGGLAMVTAAIPRTWAISRPSAQEGDGKEVDEAAVAKGASATERLRTKDFSELTPAEKDEVRAMMTRMRWQPADAFSRRRRPASAGDRPDLRRTLKKAVGPTGDLLRIATTTHRARRRPLILIADVSGSMERYSEMLLYFAHAAQGRLGRLEAFVFSTRLTRITRQLGRRDPTQAIQEVADAVHDWSGGTRIGEALHRFNQDWSRRVTRGGPIALVVSDGWDRGEPGLLATEMGRLRRSVHRVIWLNPLAGRLGYAPETRGMRAAMPHIDDFLAAGNLSDLGTLVDLLESIPSASRA